MKVAVAAWPIDSPLRNPQGLLTAFDAPLMQSIVPLIFLLFFIPAAVYGYVAGTVTSHRDLVAGMSKTMSTMGYYLAMIFFAAQFTVSFARSNIGALLSVEGADLLKSLPRGANALVVIDAANLLNTDAAEAGGWKQKRAMAYGQRPLMIPPEATRVVIGAQLDPNAGLTPTWELAVVDLSEKFPMTAIARAEGGYIDTVNGAEAVWAPTGAYFVELGEQTLGILRPTNRQFVSRWVEFSQP